MSESNLDSWSKEELLAELRHRQRRVGAPPATRAGGGPKGLHPDLDDVTNSRLASVLRDRQRVVYGTDDRQDLFAVKSKKVHAVSNAVAALVKASDLREQADGSFELRTSSYAAEFELCGNEPFASQPLGCFCSSFLVGPDVVATAGHCVKSAADLASLRFVFGFRMKDAQAANTTFAADDVYEGKANSGSPVFGAGSYKVEGILVRGENDFVSNGSCSVSLVCPTTGCRGEDVTRSTVWAGKVPKASVTPKYRPGAKRPKRR